MLVATPHSAVLCRCVFRPGPLHMSVVMFVGVVRRAVAVNVNTGMALTASVAGRFG